MQTTIEIFDRFGRFVMPDASVIEAMDPDTQERFKGVQEASAALETFKATRKTPQAVTDAVAARDAAEAELFRVQPAVDRIAMTKEWIRSQRAE
jgi:hypothetical protein